MIIFLSVCGGCMLFFAISVLLGGDHDTSIDHSDIDFHGDVDHGDMDHGHGMSSVFTIRNLALFGIGWGGAGAIARYHGLSMEASGLIGVGFGLVLGAVGYLLFRALYGQQSNSLVSEKSLTGTRARVTVSIPSEGYGEIVATNVHGSDNYLRAQSADRERFKVGDMVTISDIVGGTALVIR